MSRILIIDDDPNICSILEKLVESIGHHSAIANTLEDGLNFAQINHYDLVLLDLEFPMGNGLQILPDLLKVSSSPEVIIITGAGDTRGAEQAYKYGAWDYIPKPFIMDEVTLPISRALQYIHEKETAKPPITLKRTGIVGESNALCSCLEDVARTVMSEASVLITGETGTGKELFARAIHINSRRSSGNLITVDCGALPETLVESTLFGHEKGAFTGAERRQEGLIQQAEGGTLFLDEIGELPLTTQISLLRTLQEHRLRPVGGKSEIPVDFRLIAATNRDLDKMVKEKKFREDLFFRIRAIELKIPPLRERGQDIQEIAISKIHQLTQRYGLGAKGVSPEFLETLSAHEWPGNVRELINMLEYALASAGNDPTLYPKHLPPEYRTVMITGRSGRIPKISEFQKCMPDTDGEFPTMTEYRDSTEKEYLRMLLVKAGGNREEACRLSGISQSRLYGLLSKHNLSRFPQ